MIREEKVILVYQSTLGIVAQDYDKAFKLTVRIT